MLRTTKRNIELPLNQRPTRCLHVAGVFSRKSEGLKAEFLAPENQFAPGSGSQRSLSDCGRKSPNVRLRVAPLRGSGQVLLCNWGKAATLLDPLCLSGKVLVD